MGLADFERRLERGVEGVFGRVFRSEVRPVELARKLVREMDNGRTVGVNGAVMAPNDFQIHLSPTDVESLEDLAASLVAELAELGAEHATDEQYRLSGPVRVEILRDESLRAGVVTVIGRFREPDPADIVATLLLPAGDSVPLADDVITIGRQHDNVIVLADPNASRCHAEIRPSATGYEAVDLGSTNGTSVNGSKITRHELAHGDTITIGNTVLQYRSQ